MILPRKKIAYSQRLGERSHVLASYLVYPCGLLPLLRQVYGTTSLLKRLLTIFVYSSDTQLPRYTTLSSLGLTRHYL